MTYQGGYSPPPKQSSTALWVILGLVALLAIAAGGKWVYDQRNDATPTPKAAPGTSSVAPTPTPTPTAPLAPQSRQPQPSQPSQPSQPPQPPKPAGPQPVNKTADNPLFAKPDAGLPNLKCRFTAPFSTKPDQARKFITTAVQCLDQMWQPVMNQANLPWESPELVIEDHDSSGEAVNTEGYAAFYSNRTNTIHFPLDHLTKNLNDPSGGAVVLLIIGHEYGHHIQNLSGITAASGRGTTAAGLEADRRVELEANCFGGMLLGSGVAAGWLPAEYALVAVKDFYHRGDHNPNEARTHGTEQHSGGWTEEGYESNRLAACNTWLAPAGAVA